MRGATRNTRLRTFRKIEALADREAAGVCLLLWQAASGKQHCACRSAQGSYYLKQFVLGIGRESEHYRPALELLTATEEKLEKAEALDRQMVRVEGGTFTMGMYVRAEGLRW